MKLNYLAIEHCARPLCLCVWPYFSLWFWLNRLNVLERLLPMRLRTSLKPCPVAEKPLRQFIPSTQRAICALAPDLCDCTVFRVLNSSFCAVLWCTKCIYAYGWWCAASMCYIETIRSTNKVHAWINGISRALMAMEMHEFTHKNV